MTHDQALSLIELYRKKVGKDDGFVVWVYLGSFCIQGEFFCFPSVAEIMIKNPATYDKHGNFKDIRRTMTAIQLRHVDRMFLIQGDVEKEYRNQEESLYR